MITALIALTIGLGTFLLYNKFGIDLYEKKFGKKPSSLSITFKSNMPLFISFMMISLGCILIANYSIMFEIHGDYQFFSWFNVSALALCGVPAMANIMNKKVNLPHTVSALIGFAGFAASFWIDYGAWYLTLSMIAIGIATYFDYSDDRRLVYFLEKNLILYGLLIGLYIVALSQIIKNIL